MNEYQKTFDLALKIFVYGSVALYFLGFLKFLPNGKFVGYIGRDTDSETGFLIFDMKHPEAKNFFDRYEWYYNTDAIYTKSEFHDGFIFDVIKKEKITKSYVSGQLNINVINLSDDMYNLYKANLKIKRLLSEKTGLHFNNFN